MPPPLYAARCSPAPAHTCLTPVARWVPCSSNIHDQQTMGRSGQWHRNWCRPYKLYSDLNSQLKWPADHWPLSDLLTLKVVSESRVTWVTSVPILVFLGLSVLNLGPMYATDRQTDVRQKHCLMPCLLGGGQNKSWRDLRCHFLPRSWHECTRPGSEAVYRTSSECCTAKTRRERSWRTGWLLEPGRSTTDSDVRDELSRPECCKPAACHTTQRMNCLTVPNTTAFWLDLAGNGCNHSFLHTLKLSGFCIISLFFHIPFSASTLLVWQQKGHPACQKLGVGLLVVTI